MEAITIRPPYLIFFGAEVQQGYAKTGIGLADWRPNLCKGQLRLSGCCIDAGLPDMSIAEAKAVGVNTLVLGIASAGGAVAPEWHDTIEEAIKAGLDVVSGAHQRLDDFPRFKSAAAISGARLIDVRVAPKALAIGTGRKRQGFRLLSVGTDCAVGKKYTALALERDMQAAGINATFRATGQTGIMISGFGIALDSVVSDFLSGAAESLSPDNDVDHWDVVEGQGGIFHPGYAAVSMGLLMGSQPDAFVVCHDASRKQMMGWEGYPIPKIVDVIERTQSIGQQTNPNITCVGVSVNTSRLGTDECEQYLRSISDSLNLPCVDPVRHGTSKIVANLEKTFRLDAGMLRMHPGM